MYRIERPEFLYAFVIVILLIALYFLLQHWKRLSLKKLGDERVIRQLMPDVSMFRSSFKYFVLVFAVIFIIIALVNPQIGSKLEKAKRKGVDIMVALDVSNSMLAEDIRPNRLTRAKYSISKMIDDLQSDRIGLVIFAGKAYKQLPITIDYAAAKMFIETVKTDLVPTQGTNIGDAIDMAMSSFNLEENTKNKVIIIITDGENHEDDVMPKVQAAAEKGIVIHTIGMGLPEGAPIPIMKGNVNIGYKKDNSGNTIISKLNETMLQQIAATGNGTYVRATNAQSGLKTIMNEIDKLEKKEIETKMFSDYEDRFYYFVAIALILVIFELLIYERRSKWIRKLNLFGEESKNKNK